MTAYVRLDEAVERITRLREQLLADHSATDRAARLALTFDSEADTWSQLFELSPHRLVWRAALAAEQLARRNAAAWRHRALAERGADWSDAAAASSCRREPLCREMAAVGER